MGILGNIISAIFHHAGVTSPASAQGAPSSAPASGSSPSPSAMPPKPASPVDVNAVLTKLAAANKEKLDWRHSIVDLMKLLNLDSSLTARKALADEASLQRRQERFGRHECLAQKQVMQKLAENGGNVPPELRK